MVNSVTKIFDLCLHLCRIVQKLNFLQIEGCEQVTDASLQAMRDYVQQREVAQVGNKEIIYWICNRQKPNHKYSPLPPLLLPALKKGNFLVHIFL